MKLALAFALVLMCGGCAAKKHPAQPIPSPPQIEKPKPRPIRPGDMILKTENGVVVCHRPIQEIDAKKKQENVTVYLCR